jgi:hypothetical protein
MPSKVATGKVIETARVVYFFEACVTEHQSGQRIVVGWIRTRGKQEPNLCPNRQLRR